jgi:general secretion pathway protein J
MTQAMQRAKGSRAVNGIGRRAFVAEVHAGGVRGGWKPHQRGAAFTLIELLLAVAIFGIVLAAINTVFFGAMRLRNKTVAAIQEALPLQQTLTLMKHDLQGLMVPGTIAGALQTAQASGVTSQQQQQGGTVFYTCTAALDDITPFGDVQKVTYSLRNGDNRTAGRDLVRVVNRNVLGTQEQLLEQWLMSGVENLQFSYYDGSTWKDFWDSTTADTFTGRTNLLPRAVKVQIQLAANYGDARKLPTEMVVPIVVEGRTNVVQSTGGQQ